MLKAAFSTLGCKVNQVETAALQEMFKKRGFIIADFDECVDLYVINTCCVTKTSEQKSRQLIHKARSRNPGVPVLVTGCYAQTSAGRLLKEPGVALVVGTKERQDLVDKALQLLERKKNPESMVSSFSGQEKFEESTSQGFSERTRATLKIQEGCENFCSYCIVPLARGPVRSMEPRKVLAKIEEMTARGYKEIVLAGVHLGVYGKDLPGTPSLAGVVEKAVQIPGLERLRLGSLDPQDVTDELIEVITGNLVCCPHLHLSLQSGSDKILALMNRSYNTAYFAALVEKIRRRARGIFAFSTDLIVGFPGETDELFNETLNFIYQIGFSRMHIFPYSPRPGTPAAKWEGQINAAIKKERVRRVKIAAGEMAVSFHRQFIGKNTGVLVEEKKKEYWTGYNKQYIQVKFPASCGEIRNQIVSVNITRADARGIVGFMVES